MLDPFFIAAVILVIGLFYILPLLIITFVHKWVKKEWNKQLAISVSITLILIFCYTIYRDFYPSDKSHINHFEEHTKIKFPATRKVVDKNSSASIFDFGGKVLCSFIKLNKQDYNNLYGVISKSNFKKRDYYLETKEIDEVISKIKNTKTKEIFIQEKLGMEYTILFLPDQNSVILYFASW